MPYLGAVNVLDLLLAAIALMALLGGLRSGLIARAASWVGVVVGLVLASRTVPLALGMIDDGSPPLRLFVGLSVLAATVGIAGAVFGAVGATMRRSITTTSFGPLDRIGGAIAGVLMTATLVWFLTPAAADVPGTIAAQVRGSHIVAAIDSVTPQPPDAVRAIRGLVDSSRFPEVFADLGQTPDTGPPPETVGVDEQVLAEVSRSTARVRADGCGRRYEGSSFVVGDELMATNAHVVAGADHVEVRFPDGATRDAVVVVYDPDRDLALLAVGGLDRPALTLVDAEPGTDAAVIGYPGGQSVPRIAPARIDQQRHAIGRDIYGRTHTERSVVFLAAELRQGDSGSPVVTPQGDVSGVVFAISPDRRGVAYALDVDEVRAALGAPRNPGVTGACM